MENGRTHRYLHVAVRADSQEDVLSGPRQVGKTTLAKAVMEEYPRAQYLNCDVAGDRRVLLAQAWRPRAGLLVLDEVHKMRDWKAYLKGAFDGRPEQQSIIVTGSSRMDTFHQSGESLAGRYFALRLHPLSVREWCQSSGASTDDALERLLERGGFQGGSVRTIVWAKS
jgi:predicted AAA+ superfamily ATPase